MKAKAIVAACLALSACDRPRDVTQADVDAFLAEKQATVLGQRWRDTVDWDYRQSKYASLAFPDVPIASPALWDWQEHAILWGMRQVSEWASNAPASPGTSSAVIVSSTATAGTMFYGNTWCSSAPQIVWISR